MIRDVWYHQIGNAYVDQASNDMGQYTYYWNHALVSDHTYAIIHSSCNFSGRGYSDKCGTAISKADQEVGVIDYYNIYAPQCDGSNSSSGVAVNRHYS